MFSLHSTLTTLHLAPSVFDKTSLNLSNTNLAHGGSIVFHGECQIRYILGCINLLLKNKYSSMECKTEAYEEYNYKLDKQHARMVWTHDKVDSWY